MVESGEKWCVVERMWQSGCGAIHEVVRGETAISGDKRVFIMFMGEYSHTIDAKGRLIIPSKFREQLGEEFVLTKDWTDVFPFTQTTNGLPLKKS